MARPRAAQFAKDIGVSTNQAKKLINEGRRRKDGGSNILEATMADAKTKPVKPVKAGMGKVLVQEKDNKFVAGMGKAYMAEPRKVQIK